MQHFWDHLWFLIKCNFFQLHLFIYLFILLYINMYYIPTYCYIISIYNVEWNEWRKCFRNLESLMVDLSAQFSSTYTHTHTHTHQQNRRWKLCRPTYIRYMQIMAFHLQFYELLYIFSCTPTFSSAAKSAAIDTTELKVTGSSLLVLQHSPAKHTTIAAPFVSPFFPLSSCSRIRWLFHFAAKISIDMLLAFWI